jgi:hypothetical protein
MLAEKNKTNDSKEKKGSIYRSSRSKGTMSREGRGVGKRSINTYKPKQVVICPVWRKGERETTRHETQNAGQNARQNPEQKENKTGKQDGE